MALKKVRFSSRVSIFKIEKIGERNAKRELYAFQLLSRSLRRKLSLKNKSKLKKVNKHFNDIMISKPKILRNIKNMVRDVMMENIELIIES